MRNDGEVTVFVLQAQSTDSKENKKWFAASLDHFGTPQGFSASGDCWQRTGISGTFDEEEGLSALLVMAKEHVEYNWRLMRLEIKQHHYEVARMSAKAPGKKSPTGGCFDPEVVRRARAVANINRNINQ